MFSLATRAAFSFFARIAVASAVSISCMILVTFILSFTLDATGATTALVPIAANPSSAALIPNKPKEAPYLPSFHKALASRTFCGTSVTPNTAPVTGAKSAPLIIKLIFSNDIFVSSNLSTAAALIGLGSNNISCILSRNCFFFISNCSILFCATLSDCGLGTIKAL